MAQRSHAHKLPHPYKLPSRQVQKYAQHTEFAVRPPKTIPVGTTLPRQRPIVIKWDVWDVDLDFRDQLRAHAWLYRPPKHAAGEGTKVGGPFTAEVYAYVDIDRDQMEQQQQQQTPTPMSPPLPPRKPRTIYFRFPPECIPFSKKGEFRFVVHLQIDRGGFISTTWRPTTTTQKGDSSSGNASLTRTVDAPLIEVVDDAENAELARKFEPNN